MCPTIHKVFSEFRSHRQKAAALERRLLVYRRHYFGRVVTLETSRGREVGIIVHERECPSEKVAVLHKEGITLWHPISTVLTMRSDRLPDWTQTPEIRNALSRYRPI